MTRRAHTSMKVAFAMQKYLDSESTDYAALMAASARYAQSTHAVVHVLIPRKPGITMIARDVASEVEIVFQVMIESNIVDACFDGSRSGPSHETARRRPHRKAWFTAALSILRIHSGG